MEALLKLGEHPALALVMGGLALGLLVVVRMIARSRADAEEVPGLEALLSEGRYHDAAMLCIRHDRLSEAQELFLRAQEPARAAQIAARMGNHRLAGELYERAGETQRAATSYERAGLAQKARELLAEAAPPEATMVDAPVAPTSGDAARGATTKPTPQARRMTAVNGHPAAQIPARKAEASAETKLRAMLSKGATDAASKVELQQVAQQAAEEALAAGEIRKAADMYRDAGLHDEAIHLFANVLGAPGEAAALVAARGHHDRAAELYELAGQKERAAAAWVECARKGDRVAPFVDRIERNDARVAMRFFEEVTASRPADDDSAEAYYRLGRGLEGAGERGRALEVFRKLQRGVAGYRDVVARVSELESSVGSRATMLANAAPGHGPFGHPAVTNPRGAPSDAQGADAQPQLTTVVVQNFQVSGDLKPGEMEAIAREAARSANGRAATAMFGAITVDRSGVAGLESAPVSLELLLDGEVKAAREGPSLEALKRFTGSGGCDLSNIEVYYRMGLACLAGGDWDSALKNFEAVEDASPGYRDARRRADVIRQWKSSMGGKITLGGTALAQGGAAAPRYTLRGELGRGGMAVVYRATDTVLDRDVALKFIAESALEKKEMREMFLREARSVAQLNHPNIVTIYDVGTLDGRTFIAMEFVEGKTVDDLVVEQKKLGVPEALRITAQVLAALDYAHGRSIVHRDVKPSNMMHSPNGLVKLMDFGLAKSLNATAKASIVAGTPAYMPPEQFTGKNVDHRADLFAVGASLYEMLSGELPFEGYVRTSPPSLRERFPEVPAAIDEALRVVMDPDPAKRFQSAKDFLAPIQRVLAVIDRAVEEREARRSHPDRLIAPAVTAPQRPAPVARPKPTTAVMDEPVRFSSKSPNATRPPAAEPPSQKATLDAEDIHRIPTRPQRVARPAASQSEDSLPRPVSRPKATLAMNAFEAPVALEASTPYADPARAPAALGVSSTLPPSPSPSSRNDAPAEAFKSRKGTLLMHAAPTSGHAPPLQAPQSNASRPANRWITRPLPAASEPSRRRPTSTLPPPA